MMSLTFCSVQLWPSLLKHGSDHGMEKLWPVIQKLPDFPIQPSCHPLKRQAGLVLMYRHTRYRKSLLPSAIVFTMLHHHAPCLLRLVDPHGIKKNRDTPEKTCVRHGPDAAMSTFGLKSPQNLTEEKQRKPVELLTSPSRICQE